MKLNKTFFGIILVIVIVLVTLGKSYSFFTDSLNTSIDIKTLDSNSGKMILGFQNNTNEISFSDVEPSNDIIFSKSFSITANNNLIDESMGYSIYLQVLYNNFENGDLYFLFGGKGDENGTVSSYADGTTKYYVSRCIQNVVNMSLGNGFFVNADGTVHTYILNFYYPKNVNNFDRNNRVFSSKIVIKNFN